MIADAVAAVAIDGRFAIPAVFPVAIIEVVVLS